MIRKTDYQTQNRAYQAGREILVQGIVLHSYGTPQPDPEVLSKRWDSAAASACVHEHIGRDEAIITLPCLEEKGKARRAWHVGSGSRGSANNTHLAVEMTEPASIKYVGGSSWIELGDGSGTKAHVLATYKNAVQEFADMCKFHGLNPLNPGVILSHSEAHKNGVASNHADVEHIWKHFGLSMDQFRRDVSAAVNGSPVDFGDVDVTDTSRQPVHPLDGCVMVIYEGADGLNIRTAPDYNAVVQQVVYGGTYTVTGISADERWYRLKSGGYVTAIPDYVRFQATEEQKESTAGTGYFRVRTSWEDAQSQIGAFKTEENAIELCRQNRGYRVYDNSGNEIYPKAAEQKAPQKVRVKIPNLKIRKGPGTTYDYQKKNGKALYTGEGVFTVTETSEGPGAKMWGLLKSYESGRDGWIALDDAYVEIL